MEISLAGQVAVVTGASKGIGLATARMLASAGASVLLTSRKPDALEEATRSILADQPDADVSWLAANSGAAETPAAIVAAAQERYGRLDVVVNNAATNPYFGDTLGISDSQWDKTFEVNLKGVHALVREARDLLAADGGGSVVNIASVGGLMVEPGIGVYNVTKAALIHLTRTLAVDLGPSIRVNAVAPGLVKTDMARGLWEQHEDAIAKRFPLQRLGEPDDIAGAVLYLASPLAAWVTGETLVVDGGALRR